NESWTDTIFAALEAFWLPRLGDAITRRLYRLDGFNERVIRGLHRRHDDGHVVHSTGFKEREQRLVSLTHDASPQTSPPQCGRQRRRPGWCRYSQGARSPLGPRRKRCRAPCARRPPPAAAATLRRMSFRGRLRRGPREA